MSSPRTVSSTELRTRFAARLSNLYGDEVPAYRTLVEVSQEVNQRVIARDGNRTGVSRAVPDLGVGPFGPSVSDKAGRRTKSDPVP